MKAPRKDSMSSVAAARREWTYRDLVVEILSPGTRRRDKGRKRAVYDREGAQEYWIVDPEAQSITALRRPRAGGGLTDVTTATAAAGDVLASPLFPGLRIPLRDVFRGR